jgi:predicted RNA-binding Zn-ribbon protein involved in translation (DUF1610 family)
MRRKKDRQLKNANICPKCESTDIIKIPGRSGGYGSLVNNRPISLTAFNVIYVTRYLCASCGFSEEWIDREDDIQEIKEKYTEE